jgi:hypothetical protein
MPLDRLEQFAFAHGEEVVLSRYNHAESVATAVGQAFSEEDVLQDYLYSLMELVAERRTLEKEDYIRMNEQALQKMRNLHGQR